MSVAHSKTTIQISQSENADCCLISAWAGEEKMTAVLFTSGQEFSREREQTSKKPEAGSGWHVEM